MLSSHTQKTVRGIAWNFLRVFGQTALSLGTGIVLARLLPPADFGLLALAMVFIGFAELVASVGMGPAVVQQQNLSPLHVRVATTLSLAVGTVLALCCWLLASPLATFFDDPRVADILRVLSVGLWFSAATAVNRGLLQRRLDFRQLFYIDVGSYAFGYTGVATTLALLDFGVWSLVFGTVTSLVLQALLVAFVEPPPRRLALSRPEALQLLGFGSGVSINNTINYLAANVDYIVIGKLLNATVLGLYTRAFQLVTMPLSKIAATLGGALFPSYAEIQNDPKRLGRAYLKAVNATALLTFPILTGFAVSAEIVIVGLYGENWRPATAAFRILCLAGVFKAIFHLAGPVAQATGNIFGEVRRQTVYLAVLTTGCLLAAPYGIEAVAWAVVAGSLWLYLAMAQLVRRITGCGWADFFRSQLPGACVSALIAIVQLACIRLDSLWLHLPPTLSLILLIAVSGLAGAWAFFYLDPRLVGPMPAWLCRHYAHKIPQPFRSWVERRFP